MNIIDHDKHRFFRLLFAFAAGTIVACGSGGGDSTGGMPDGSAAEGSGGAQNSSGGAGGDQDSGTSTGSGGTAAGIHCEGELSDTCTCISDHNHVWGPGDTGGACSSSALGNGVCCADPEYPGSGTCQCSKWGCFESNSTCTCGIIYPDQPAGTCAKTWSLCCLSEGLCTCTNFGTSCQANEMQVPTCGVPEAQCSATQIKVPDCRPK
jgi:hypothetical protein